MKRLLSFLAGLLMIGTALVGCGGGGSGTITSTSPGTGAPTIASFSASPTTIAQGSSATLSWSVSNATTLTIDNNVGTVTGTSITVTPTTTTTYTLTATNNAGSTTASVTVTVNTGANNTPPVIGAFTASPSTVTAGSASTLSWAVTGATSLSIDNGVGSVSGTSTSVTPSTTTTYKLTATNTYGASTATATVTVNSTASASWHYGSMATADLGIGANLNGSVPFPQDNAWNTDISNTTTYPVDPNSANLIASIGTTTTTGVHPDFGSDGSGIPYIVVPGTQALVNITFNAYGYESDSGPYPAPSNAPVEGGSNSTGDRHVLVIDRDHNRLYEMGGAYLQTDNSWVAAVGAIFHLDSDTVRPGAQAGWTSADAAGLPIFPGLVRYDEAASGTIPHALRFTVASTREAYVPPANHWASSSTSTNLPPMGMRVRLKASFVIPSSYSTAGKAILQAMKTYGMFVADNGSDWFVTGAPDSRWDSPTLATELGSVKGSDFEVVKMTGLVTP